MYFGQKKTFGLKMACYTGPHTEEYTMKALLVISVLGLTAGCSQFGQPSSGQSSSKPEPMHNSQVERVTPTPSPFQPARFVLPSPAEQQSPQSKVTIHHVVRGLMHDVINTMEHVNESTSVAVASFVFLDSDYYQGSLLGNQIAESFLHELNLFGIRVLDYKVTDFIRVTPQGDFALSRDYEELSDNVAAQYVLSGTLTQHRDGVLVHARIVNIASKQVVATAQDLIPSRIVNALSPSINQARPVLLVGETEG
jgi:TolB-like protein